MVGLLHQFQLSGKHQSLESMIVEVSQYNHLCQVFRIALLRNHKVFNRYYSIVTRFLFKFLYFIKLSDILIVDIPVDKQRFLLQAITLRFSH